MNYSLEVQHMCPVAKGPDHGPAPIPEEGRWVQAKEIKDISAYTHGVGWCAPQQGACKLSLNVKNGIIEEALVETVGCSGMTHSAAMAAEILPGKTLLEALNTDLVCDAINTAMRELFLQIVYGRSQSAFSEDGLVIGAGMEDLGKGFRSMVGTMYGTKAKGVRYLEMTEGYCTRMALDADNQVIGYEFVSLGKMTDLIKKGIEPNDAYEQSKGTYGRFADAVHVNAAHEIMLGRHHRNRLFGYIVSFVQTVLPDVREVRPDLVFGNRRKGEPHMGLVFLFHLRENGVCHHISRQKFVDKPFALTVQQDGSLAAHGFGDQEFPSVFFRVQGRGMNLDVVDVL